MRRNRSLVAFAALSLLVACGKSAEKPAAPAAAETPAASATAPAAAPAAAPAEGSTMMASTNSVGVPECDNYVKKYMECVGSKIPETARAQYKTSFDAMVASWKQIAATPEGKAGLAAACTQATTAAAQAMTAYGCTF